MKACKCGNECANNAKNCPKCGHRFTSTFTKFVLGVFIVGGVMMIIGGIAGTSATSAPSNTSASSVDPKDVLLHSVKLDFRWSTGGFDTVMLADFTITNPTTYRFKDFEVKCTHFAPSGTEIDSNTRTIYQVIEPKSKKVIKGMNMGFIHNQVKSSSCEITDLVVL